MATAETATATATATTTDKVILSKKPRRSAATNVCLLTSYTAPPTGDSDNTSSHIATHQYEVGVDEAGRGPLFGRVYTGAVILPSADDASRPFDFSILKDSKKFHSEKKYEKYRITSKNMRWHGRSRMRNQRSLIR